MTSAQVVKTSVTNNSSSQNYSHPDDHTIRTTDTPGFKPFTMQCLLCLLSYFKYHIFILLSNNNLIFIPIYNKQGSWMLCSQLFSIDLGYTLFVFLTQVQNSMMFIFFDLSWNHFLLDLCPMVCCSIPLAFSLLTLSTLFSIEASPGCNVTSSGLFS